MYTGSKTRPIHVRTWIGLVHRGIQHFIGVSPPRGEDRKPIEYRTAFLQYNAFIFTQNNFRE